MQDSKTMAWVYLLVGLAAVVAACFFLYLDALGSSKGLALFDWAMLVMGGAAVYWGVKSLRGLGKDKGPDAS